MAVPAAGVVCRAQSPAAPDLIEAAFLTHVRPLCGSFRPLEQVTARPAARRRPAEKPKRVDYSKVKSRVKESITELDASYDSHHYEEVWEMPRKRSIPAVPFPPFVPRLCDPRIPRAAFSSAQLRAPSVPAVTPTSWSFLSVDTCPGCDTTDCPPP